MLDQGSQDRGRRRSAERPDKRPVIVAGASLPAGVAGSDLGGVVEKVFCHSQHETFSISERLNDSPAPSLRAKPSNPEATKQVWIASAFARRLRRTGRRKCPSP